MKTLEKLEAKLTSKETDTFVNDIQCELTVSGTLPKLLPDSEVVRVVREAVLHYNQHYQTNLFRRLINSRNPIKWYSLFQFRKYVTGKAKIQLSKLVSSEQAHTLKHEGDCMVSEATHTSLDIWH